MGRQNYSDFNNIVYAVIPRGVKILDVGCGNGILGREIRRGKKPKELIGIEVDEVSSRKARKFYDKMVVGDVERLVELPFKKKYFDCVVLADILEHLRSPKALIRLTGEYLKDDGIIIISVPNVAFVVNRVVLLFGKFDYGDKGILDRSHVCFFTYLSVQKLIEELGFKIAVRKGYIITRKSLKFVNLFAGLCPSLFAYQFLLVIKKKVA